MGTDTETPQGFGGGGGKLVQHYRSYWDDQEELMNTFAYIPPWSWYAAWPVPAQLVKKRTGRVQRRWEMHTF